MYSVVQDVKTGAVDPNWIRRLSDGAFISANPVNGDYRQFLAWQQAGGKLQQTDPFYSPYVAPQLTPEQIQQQINSLQQQLDNITES